MSVVFIGGDEPYLVDAKRKSLIGTLQMPELNLMYAECLDHTVLDHLHTYPILDEKRIAVVTVDKLSDVHNEFFKECIEDEYGLLLVLFKSYDGRSSFYKGWKKEGNIILCNKQDAASNLSSFILKKALNMGCNFTGNALQEFLQRMNYVENESIHIYTILGYLESMAALSPSITEETVRAIVPAFQSEEIFSIVDMILSKDLSGLRTQATLLKKDAIGTLSALLREYRIAYKAKYFPYKEIGISTCRLKSHSKESLIKGILFITDQITAIKSGTVSEELILEDTFFRLLNS